ncbi:MAG: hypothetical protein JST89_16430 [Cyanobacteria bacterium SZAS-4]|nr:hypothetical protein [Cyanobacteria bacterium SZAS-4]
MSINLTQLTSAVALTLTLLFPTTVLANGPSDSFNSLIARYIDLARKQDHKALLASDLCLRISHDLNQENVDKVTLVKTIEEVLSLYPVLSAQNQRCMAYRMLALGNLFLDGSPIIKPDPPPRGHFDFKSKKFIDANLGNKLIECVLHAAKNGHWPADESLMSALNAVASNTELNSETRTELENVQQSIKLEKTNYNVRPIIASLKSITEANWATATQYQKPMPWKQYPLSWEKYLPAQPADTPAELKRGAMAHSIIIKEFPKPAAAQIRDSIEQLSKIYPTLSEFDQHDVCVSIMDVTQTLLRTNLNDAADSLFWLVFPSIKVGWLDNGSVAGGLLGNYSYYVQAYRLPQAISIVQKVIAFESAGDYNQASEINRRTVLGDAYDMHKERARAKEQYVIVDRLNEELHRKGFFDEQSYNMYRDEMKVRLTEYRSHKSR